MACKSNNRKGNKRGQLALAAAAVGLSALGMVQSAQAANYTWNGGATGTWDTTTTNWLNAGSSTAFGAGGNWAYFTTGTDATVTMNATLAAQAILASDNVSVTGGGTINTGNNLTLGASAGKTLEIGINKITAPATKGILVTETTYRGGTVKLSTTTVNISQFQILGNSTVEQTTGTITISGSTYTGGPVTFLGSTTAGTYTLSGGILDNQNTVTTSFSNAWAIGNGGTGTMNVDGSQSVFRSLGTILVGNTQTGTLNFKQGVIEATEINRNTTVQANSNFNFGGTVGTATLRPLAGYNLTLGNSSKTPTVTLTGTNAVISSSDKDAAARTVDVYSAIGDGGSGRGLTFSGGGTTTLYANNTYTGETKIATTGSGKVTLANNGGTSALSSSSTLHVVGGATFADGYTTGRDLTFAGLKSSGTGTASITLGTTGKKVIAGAVNMQDGNIDTLSITNGGLSLNSGSILNFDLGTSNTSDLVSLTGALTVNGNLNLSLTGNGAGNGTYKLFGFTSQTGFTGGTITSVGGTAGSITLAGVTGLTNKKYVFSATGSEIDLAISDNAAYTKALLALGAITAPARMISGGTVNVSAVVSNTNSDSGADTLTWSANNGSTGGLTFSGGGTLSGGGSTTVNGSFTSSTTGLNALKVVAGGTSTNLNEAVTGGTASANIAVLDLRSIAQSGQVDAGRLMKGSSKSFSGTASLTTSGDDDHYTRLSVQGVSGTVNAGGTYSASVSGTVSAASGNLNSLVVTSAETGLGDTYNNVAIAYSAQVFNPIELVASSSYNAFNSGSNTVSVSGSNGNYVFTPATNATGTQQAFVTVDTSKATGFAAPEFVLLALKDVTGQNNLTAQNVAMAINNAGLSGVTAAYYGEDLGTNKMLADWSGYAHYKNGSFTEDFDVLVKFGSLGGDKLAFDFSQIDGGVAVTAIGVVPEPTSLGLMALPALGLLARRRRAMKKA